MLTLLRSRHRQNSGQTYGKRFEFTNICRRIGQGLWAARKDVYLCNVCVGRTAFSRRPGLITRMYSSCARTWCTLYRARGSLCRQHGVSIPSDRHKRVQGDVLCDVRNSDGSKAGNLADPDTAQYFAHHIRSSSLSIYHLSDWHRFDFDTLGRTHR